jgi:putative copper export protein
MNFARILAATAVVTAAALTVTPALAAPVSATTPATARAQIVKPLVLTATQSIDFGTILLTAVTASTAVSISQAGAITCGTGLTCSATGKQAIFNVAGSNNQTVKIATTAANITNGTTNLLFTPSAPATVLLTNSGAPGNNFNVGGSFAIDTATTDGVYTGNLIVTVDY